MNFFRKLFDESDFFCNLHLVRARANFENHSVGTEPSSLNGYPTDSQTRTRTRTVRGLAVSWSWSWYLLGFVSCSPSTALMELGLSGCICNRLERRYLEPPMARNPSWLPDAQCARRAAAGSVLSQIDMSFGDTPLLFYRRFFFTPVGETASCRGDHTTKLEARTVYSVFTRRALELCRAPRPSTSRKPMRQALSRERGPHIGLGNEPGNAKWNASKSEMKSKDFHRNTNICDTV